jgi:hypothetical protein
MLKSAQILPIFDNPINKTKVRKDVYAYRYRTGLITIGNYELGFERYHMYTMAEAIKIWRSKNQLKSINNERSI